MADGTPKKRPRVEEETRCRYLKFSNLPHGCTSDEMRVLLEPLGKVEEVQVARALGGGMVALVEMSCTREATSAKRRLNDMPLRGSELSVAFDPARSEQQQAATSSPSPAQQQPSSSQSSQPPAASQSGGSATAADNAVNPFNPSSKLPPFFVPDRMVRDVHDLRVLKMRSVLWTAREEDIRQFFRGIQLDRDAVEMGRDHAGRFSGMCYIRMRTTSDLALALRRQSEYLCGRQVILQRLDPGTPNIFRTGGAGTERPGERREPLGREGTGREDKLGQTPQSATVYMEPRPWPTQRPSGGATADEAGGQTAALKQALSVAPLNESLAAVRQFLAKVGRAEMEPPGPHAWDVCALLRALVGSDWIVSHTERVFSLSVPSL